MNFDELSDEAKAKAQKIETSEELATLAMQEGVELTDEQLDAVAGGGDWCKNNAPCRSHQSDLPEV